MTPSLRERAAAMADALDGVIDADRRERDEDGRWVGGGPGSRYREAVRRAKEVLAAFRSVPEAAGDR